MKKLAKSLTLFSLLLFMACNNDDSTTPTPINTNVNFKHKTTIKVGDAGASEITAYDKGTKKLFIVNVEKKEISVYNISNLSTPVKTDAITLANGSPNSVSVFNGKLAIALEDDVKQNNGKILVYNTTNQHLEHTFTVGALPDMVTFSKDGKMIVCANEGEPNADYTNDPMGSVSIISLENNQVTTLDFSAFNAQENELKQQGFRVFGPNADLAKDVEPEYISISDDSKTAWVSLQENNGIAKINLTTKTIEAIYPLGFKDYSKPENYIDPSDKDDKKEVRSVPVFGMYQPDGITYINIKGSGYLISANEGDSREYEGTPGYVGEERIKKITLDPTVFPESNNYQADEHLGRLKIALDMGDTDQDNDYDQLYSYGARSFSIWSENGNLLYDSGNSIAKELLARTPDRFNDNDGRSDDKGAEPESVEVLTIANERHILFVGLERTDQVLVYDISTPTNPILLDILATDGDEAPEGLLAIPANDSPNGKDLLIVANEDSGTVTIYENRP